MHEASFFIFFGLVEGGLGKLGSVYRVFVRVTREMGGSKFCLGKFCLVSKWKKMTSFPLKSSLCPSC